jgi:hypothetical protein
VSCCPRKVGYYVSVSQRLFTYAISRQQQYVLTCHAHILTQTTASGIEATLDCVEKAWSTDASSNLTFPDTANVWPKIFDANACKNCPVP